MFTGGSLQKGGQLSSETGDQTMESLQRHAGRSLWAAHPVNIIVQLQMHARFYWSFHNILKCKQMHLQGRKGLAAGAQRFPAETHETNWSHETGRQNQWSEFCLRNFKYNAHICTDSMNDCLLSLWKGFSWFNQEDQKSPSQREDRWFVFWTEQVVLWKWVSHHVFHILPCYKEMH